MQSKCTFSAINGQCYRFRSAVDYQKECDSKAGYYKHGYCYYECPDTKFLINGQCHENRSSQYTQTDCEAVGGHYVHNYCYLKACNYTMINKKCYKYRSAEYSNGTCINIGGYYAAVARYSYKHYCYYTSFDCRYLTANGQCYSRSSNHSQKICKTIPDSYYNVSSNTCYYYCTEMPKLGQCFVGDNPSFTREMCALLDGVYAYNTCHYVTLRCPKYKTTNGQCYSNRSSALTCSTCRNIGGHYENGFCYYYRNNCRAYRVDGQCYSKRMTMSLRMYSPSYCRTIGGKMSGRYCYYDRFQSSNCRYYRNCQCYLYSSRVKNPDTCANIGGYYDATIQRCLYNSSSCPYYERNRQCYTRKNSNFTAETCSVIDGYFEYSTGNNRHNCYYSNFSCNYMVNGQCYLVVSSTYHEGTCASIDGYYSRNDSACYYNYFSCSYPFGGQCYDTHIPGWSKEKCEEANGNYSFNGFFSTCYVSRFYCRYIFNGSCYRYISTSFDCSSCRLLGGHFESGSCYYARNCSQPLFIASNGQCYRNETTVRTAAECNSMTSNSFYDDRSAKCYFTTGFCSSGHYINCQCFLYKSSTYNAGSCNNFGGQYFNGICYYNSSYCSYYAFQGQCYRYFSFYNLPDMCLNIGGHYVFSLPISSTPRPRYTTTSPVVTVGACYYNSFNCSGFTVDRYYCYSNRSVTVSRATCRNIGGRYAYRRYDGTYSTYLRSSSWFYFQQTDYYCLYNTFNCRG